ncbi:DUF4118 domain-containing protein [Clostridium grantii]|uniref:histidine kinase n=1 Tax=Clostridium grantii DSM 8605 TaxID=1121316 RepID=A0A1M5T1H9_9CLOT|nr:DUF4118 domain-containing protein [Clostridium grantii]SHH44631.1 two-component system, OmpR family, sensor histidine kinase KdpD [Clostridium grantii DSM 8605]
MSLIDLIKKLHKKKITSFNLESLKFNLVKFIAIMFGATLLAFMFKYINISESNIIISFILAVQLIAKNTDGYLYGILASITGVLTFNFFFVEPYYKFISYSPYYAATFIIMLSAAILTSTLTAKVKQEALLSNQREKRTEILYQINKSLLMVRGLNELVEVCTKDFANLFNRSVIISIVNSSNCLEPPYIHRFNNDLNANFFDLSLERTIINDTLNSEKPTGVGTHIHSDIDAYYIPIKGQNGNIGVLGVSCFENNYLSDEQKYLLEAVTAQIALAVERENLWKKQQLSKMEVERERLRSNLLRGISHDLRTPLTGILGATSTISENYDILHTDIKKSLLKDIYEETSWLIHSIENILSLTKIDEGNLDVKKNMEAVEEIIGSAVSRVRKLCGFHTIKINIPNDLILIPIDGMLIEKVFINLLDNAIKYTPQNSTIIVSAELEIDNIIFEVSDNGTGINEESLPLVFNRFYTGTSSNKDIRHGTGLGLAICESIITAHKGKIYAFNNEFHGATFRFILPTRSDRNDK